MPAAPSWERMGDKSSPVKSAQGSRPKPMQESLGGLMSKPRLRSAARQNGVEGFEQDQTVAYTIKSGKIESHPSALAPVNTSDGEKFIQRVKVIPDLRGERHSRR